MLANIVKNSNQEIKLAKRQNEQLAHEAEQAKALALTLSNALKECKSMMPDVLKVLQSQDRNLALAYSALIRQYDEVFVSVESVIKQITHSHTTTTRIVNDSVKHNLDPSMFLGRKTVEALISSSLREK